MPREDTIACSQIARAVVACAARSAACCPFLPLDDTPPGGSGLQRSSLIMELYC